MARDVWARMRRWPYLDEIVNRNVCLIFALFGFFGGSLFGRLFRPFGRLLSLVVSG